MSKTRKDAEWWRTSVIYQIYPRSFADGNGDGMGDLQGVTSRLESLSELGVDAIWFSPFFKSPQKDAGYDVSDYKDIDPLFGNLADFDALVAKSKTLGLRIIVDLVPNHSSDQHVWFQAALKAAPGSAERNRYMFRDGKGENGELPPNNWESVFGGQAWTRINEADGKPGQWYLHIFDSTQPDFNWENEEVRDEFDSVLRFWLDRGASGFRIDVAHGMIKVDGLPDVVHHSSTMSGQDSPDDVKTQETEDELISRLEEENPFWGQPGVHEINKRFRKILDEYDERVMCGEAWVHPISRMARWVRPGEYHQTFNFGYLETPWNKEKLHAVVTESLNAFGAVGAPSTWVLSNHDVIRHATRMGYDNIPRQGDGVGPNYQQPDEAKGQRRARAASAFMLGLPGGAYIYQGEELGLPEHTTLENKYREDPTFFRTNGERVGRDGCRVPLPWEAGANDSNGFSTTGKSWLPQPESYRRYARSAQEGVAGSTLELYKALLKARKQFDMGNGEFRWAPEFMDESSLAYINNGILVLSNFNGDPVVIPAGEILATTQHDLTIEGELEHDNTVWIKL
ncbi:MAG: glycoside hydrolase family 13 protein [Actinomycetes bacterium]